MFSIGCSGNVQPLLLSQDAGDLFVSRNFFAVAVDDGPAVNTSRFQAVAGGAIEWASVEMAVHMPLRSTWMGSAPGADPPVGYSVCRAAASKARGRRYSHKPSWPIRPHSRLTVVLERAVNPGDFTARSHAVYRIFGDFVGFAFSSSTSMTVPLSASIWTSITLFSAVTTSTSQMSL